MRHLSVLMASHNGAARLPRVLEGYAQQNAGAVAWDIIVVDNASTDQTSDVIEGFRSRLPIRLVRHPTPGKNGALNSGLQAITGDGVVLTDDDAIPACDFIESWAAGFQSRPDAGLFGGTVEPLFDADVPGWLKAAELHFDALYAVRRPLDGPIEAQQIFGPNMAVRRSVFDAGLRFDERIGPNASDKYYAMGSETDFCVRAERAGHKAWSLAAPTVRHIVRREQMTWAFFNERAFRLGRGIAVRQWMTGVLIPQRKTSKLKRLAAYGLQVCKEAHAGLSRLDPRLEKRVAAAWETQWLKGFHGEYRRLKSEWHAEQSVVEAQPSKPSLQSRS